MPRRKARTRRLLIRHLLFVGVIGSLVSIGRRGDDSWEYGSGRWPSGGKPVPAPPPPPPIPTLPGRRSRARRFGAALILVGALFAGASFSALAGDHVVQMIEPRGDGDLSSVPAQPGGAPDQAASAQDPQPAAADAQAEPDPQAAADPAGDPPASGAPDSTQPPSDQAPSDPALDPAPAEPAPADPAAAPSDDSSASASASPVEDATRGAPKSFGSVGGPAGPAKRPLRHRAQPLLKPSRPSKPAAPDPEAGSPGVATIWLNRALPDPTPPSLRLSPAFADRLARSARAAGVDWAAVLAVLRAEGNLGSVPAGRRGLQVVERRLFSLGARKDLWAAALAYSGHTTFADRVAALTHYYRAVGLSALVSGLEAAKPELQHRLLRDKRVQIYFGGRGDVAAGHVDVRVLVLIAYLADTFHEVTVSSLITGHREFARPGVISAHVYGRAVDIAALDWTSIAGHQQPGGLTEKAVRAILLLPSELQPKQVISLLGLGGPSFPLANHADHIHVGY